MKNKLLGGLYGLLIGDACGVPYEFKRPGDIPADVPLDSMGVPMGYKRTYPKILPGTWSDDGAQALILLETLLQPKPSMDDFTDKLILWKDDGYMAVDNFRFDIGNQTNHYLTCHQHGYDTGANIRAEGCGNGSLMRTLPVALVYDNEDTIMHVSKIQSDVTHPQMVGVICCQLYNLVARNLLKGMAKNDAWDGAIQIMTVVYKHSEFKDILDKVLVGEKQEPMGSGYVVDALWSACYAFHAGRSYHEVISIAIRLGDDTDTTACIAGGLAGIYYGLNGIQESWRHHLRGQDVVKPLADKLIQYWNPIL